MSRSHMDGTPLSSQIVFLEKRNAELEAEVARLRATESGDLFHERQMRQAAKARAERLEEAAAYACAEFDENWKAGRMSIDAKTAHDALAKLITGTQEKG